MGFFDDVINRVEQSGQDAIDSVVGGTIDSIFPSADPLTEVQEAPSGNLTAAQIEAGQTSKPRALRPSTQPPATIARAQGASDIGMVDFAGMKLSRNVLIITGVAVFLFLSTGRR